MEAHHVGHERLRSRVVLQTDGQLKTGRDVAIAALLGAEEFGFATAPLVALGCIMMRKCHLNTCPVGIATQDQAEEKVPGPAGARGELLLHDRQELRQIMAELGFRTITEMVGRSDCLNFDQALTQWKAKGIDLSALLARPEEPEGFLGRYATDAQDHELEKALDRKLIALAQPALDQQVPVHIELPVVNTNRVVELCFPMRWPSASAPTCSRKTPSGSPDRQRRPESGGVPGSGDHAGG